LSEGDCDDVSGAQTRRRREAAAASSASGEGGFELLAELGRGGFGVVWRARDRLLRREVALKLLRADALDAPNARKNFLQEARVLASLDHPNIVRIHSVEAVDGQLRLDLELVQGVSLKDWVAGEGPRSASEAAAVGLDLCRALAAIHAKGLVHGDVKPANVMRATGGRIVLLDFGVARPSRDVAGGDAPLAGTPAFMAPEMFDDPPRADARTDVYALGGVLYWLVSAHLPIEAKTVRELVARLREERAVPLADRRPDLDPRFVAVVSKALAREPEQRFESAGAMANALARIVAGSDGELGNGKLAPSRRRRLPLGVVAAAVVAIGAAAAGLALWRPWQSASSALLLRRPPEWLLDRADRSVPLVDGDHVRAGDLLELELAPTSPTGDLHVYVVDEDSGGEKHLLFPNDVGRLRNPLASGATVRLPGPPLEAHGDDTPLEWRVTSTPEQGGVEDLYVVVASGRYEPMEQVAARLPKLEKPGDLDATTTAALTRGVGGVTRRPRPPNASSSALRLRDVIEPAAASNEDGVRVERYSIRLRNP
jgi:hypothetical protein